MGSVARIGDVLVDLCVQREYLDPRSAFHCLNCEQVARSVKHLMAFARLAKIPVLSCIDVHSANRIGADFVSIATRIPPPNQMAAFTLLPAHRLIESDNSLSMSLEVFTHVQQVIFTKVHRDPFTNPKLDRLLTEMPVRRFVVFGLPLESSVRTLVLGLLRRRRHVALIHDACGFWNRKEAEMVLRQIRVKECEVLAASDYLLPELALFSQRAGIRIRSSRSVA